MKDFAEFLGYLSITLLVVLLFMFVLNVAQKQDFLNQCDRAGGTVVYKDGKSKCYEGRFINLFLD